jgi:hypothetical protein
MGRLVMAKDSQDRHVAGRTHAKRKRTWKNHKEITVYLREGKMGAKRYAYPA